VSRNPVADLLRDVRACTICAEHLPLGPRPIVQLHPDACILIVGQAPGRKVHLSGQPFADASGLRLREWMGITPEEFYDPHRVAIVPIGLCFPGSGPSGDLPPRPECAPAWHERLVAALRRVELSVIVGKYAMDVHLPTKAGSVASRVLAWREHWPDTVPLPHPSWHNNLWLTRNPWFEAELVPQLQSRVRSVLEGHVVRGRLTQDVDSRGV
jgi:uracil-DNA glycosylase